MIKVYEVWANTFEDGWVGSHVKARFLKREDAERCAKGANSWGRDGSVYEVTVYESWDDMEKTVNEQLKKSALNKLSFEEKKALGLDEN